MRRHVYVQHEAVEYRRHLFDVGALFFYVNNKTIQVQRTGVSESEI